MTTYQAVYEPDDNHTWFVHVPQVPGAHSDGRTLQRSRANIREALALALDVEETDFELTDEIRLPAGTQALIEQVRRIRASAEEAQQAAITATAEAVQVLSTGAQQFSLRDAAEIIGVSFQRVQQLRNGMKV